MEGKGMKKTGAGCPPPFLIPLSPFPCPTFLCPTFASSCKRKKRRSGAEPPSRGEIPPRPRAIFRCLLAGGDRVQELTGVTLLGEGRFRPAGVWS